MRKDKNVRNYYGNTVTRDGHIFSLTGRELKTKNGVVKLKIGEITRTYKAARVVYEAFSGSNIQRGDVIQYRDGDRENMAYDNLYVISRVEYFKGHDWSDMNAVAEDVREKIRTEYVNNDRSKKKTTPTYASLAKKYGCSKSTIYNILKEDKKKCIKSSKE